MSIDVRDPMGIFAPHVIQDFQAVSTPFRAKAIVDNPSSKEALQGLVKACVDTPNTVCVGVSPGLRFTWTEFGIDTGVRSSDYVQIGKAGNIDFKEGRWDEGIKSIFARASALSQKKSETAAAVVIQQPTTVVEQPFPAWPFFLGFGLLAILGFISFKLLRRQYQRREKEINELREEKFEYASRNVNLMDLDTKPQSPQPSIQPLTGQQELLAAKMHEAISEVRQKEASRPRKTTPKKTHQQRVVEHHHHHDNPAPVIIAPISYSPPVSEPRRSYSSSSFDDDDDRRRSSGSGSSFDSGSSYSSGGGGGSFDSGSSGGSDSGGGGGGDF